MDLLPKVFRTEGDVVDFDPSKIFNSIVKETGMNEEDARKITELVVRRIISSGMKFLSGPHIREIVCSILSENHFEQERKLYTRIGMPLMDYEEILEKGLLGGKVGITNPERIHHRAANQLAEEYTLLRILDNDESQAHLYGDIHIHQLKYFDLRPHEQIWDPRIILENGLPPSNNLLSTCKAGPPKTLRSAVELLSNWLSIIQTEFSGTQGLEYLTIFLAPYARGLSHDEIKRDIKTLIYNINFNSNASGRLFVKSSINCIPSIIPELKNLQIKGSKILESNVYGEFGRAFDIPKYIVYLNREWLDIHSNSYKKIIEEIITHQTPFLANHEISKKLIHKKDQSANYISHGILQKISLNLPRYAFISKQDDGKFFEILERNVNLCFNILEKKFKVIKERINTGKLPLCASKIDGKLIYNLEDQILGISFVGLNEAVKLITGLEIHDENGALDFGIKILTRLSDLCVQEHEKRGLNYSLVEGSSGRAINRFLRLDSKHFPNINLKEYSDSAHFRSDISIEPEKRVKIRSKFHELVKIGAIEQINLKQLSDKGNYRKFIENLMQLSFIKNDLACLKFND
ncbi:MAG: anaerobic ribonucleoside-triphosphate reductase [Promethearchaeota archaeon]